MQRSAIIISLLAILTGISHAQQTIRVKDVVAVGNEVKISLSAPRDPKTFTLKNPPRLVIDIPDGFLIGENRTINVNDGNIEKIRIAQNSKEPYLTRIVIDLKKESPYKIKQENNDILVNLSTFESEGNRQKLKIHIEELIVTPKPPTPEVEYVAPHQISKVEEVKGEYKEIPISQNIHIPSLKNYGKIKVEINGLKLDLGKKPVYQKAKLMVKAADLCSILSYEAIFKPDENLLQIKKEGYLCGEFTLGSTVCQINGLERKLKAPPALIQEKIYLPLISTLQNLGYGIIFDRKLKTIYVEPRITRIRTVEEEMTKIVIDSSHPVKIEKETLKSRPFRLALEIPNAILDVSPESFAVNQDRIKNIDSRQIGNNVLIRIYLEKPDYYHIAKIEEKNQIQVYFPPAVFSIKSTAEADYVYVSLEATKKIKPEVKTLSDPDRILVDIPNSLFKILPLIEIDKGSVVRARGSQFKSAPLRSRIVLDLAQKGEFESQLVNDGKTLTLKILKPEGLAKREKAKKYAAFRKKVIVIDPGHGGKDPGAFGYSDSVEKTLNLKTALKLNQLLLEAGAISLLTRDDDSFVSLDDRIRFAQNNRADIFISLHYNALERSDMSGTETYYFHANSQLLAELIHKSLVENLKRLDRGVRAEKFYTIKSLNMPAVLVEPVYITNSEEERLSKQDSKQAEMARAMFEGIKEYLEVQKKL